MPERAASTADLTSLADEVGLTLVSSLSRASAELRLGFESRNLARWQMDGNAGEMAFMNRPPELFSSFEKILPSARSILLFLVPYAAKISSETECPAGYGRVARYAWGRDYHRVLKEKLSLFAASVQGRYGPIRSRSFSDAVPILERSLAQRAGSSFVGRNAMLIRPGWGSFFFIAEYLSDLEIVDAPERNDRLRAPGSGCGTCERCLRQCPTAAFSASGVLDARRCISYLTIEKRSGFTEWESSALGEWLFGCDVCQTVCPFNHGHTAAWPLPEFEPESGAGRFLKLVDLLEIRADAEFDRRFSETSIARTGRTGLLRNCCAVIANTAFLPAVDALIEVSENDRSELVRSEALRSLHRLRPLTDGMQYRRLKRRLSALPQKDEVETVPSSVVI